MGALARSRCRGSARQRSSGVLEHDGPALGLGLARHRDHHADRGDPGDGSARPAGGDPGRPPGACPGMPGALALPLDDFPGPDDVRGRTSDAYSDQVSDWQDEASAAAAADRDPGRRPAAPVRPRGGRQPQRPRPGRLATGVRPHGARTGERRCRPARAPVARDRPRPGRRPGLGARRGRDPGAEDAPRPALGRTTTTSSTTRRRTAGRSRPRALGRCGPPSGPGAVDAGPPRLLLLHPAAVGDVPAAPADRRRSTRSSSSTTTAATRRSSRGGTTSAPSSTCRCRC